MEDESVVSAREVEETAGVDGGALDIGMCGPEGIEYWMLGSR